MRIEDLVYVESNVDADAANIAFGRWSNTRYALHQATPGFGVDCVRYGASVIGEVFDYAIEIASLPADMALHAPKSARNAMREFRKQFMPNVIVTDNKVTLCDVLVMSYLDGGPGHLMLVGENCLWHVSTKSGVQRAPMITPKNMSLTRIYRHGSVRLSSSS